jgi:hypothetical protein
MQSNDLTTGMWWSSFHIGESRSFYIYHPDNAFTVTDRSYFNKDTLKVNIINGMECTETGKILPENNTVLLVQIVYNISNYWGQKNGRHIRSKNFYFYKDQLYNSKGETIKKLTKEAQEAYNEYLKRS